MVRVAFAESPEEVSVRGTLTPSGSLDATVASTAISGESLRAPGTTSADVLSRVPGVQVSRSGSSSDLATAAIRGATSAQTPIYLAGVRLNDDITGTADLSTLPLFLMQRVEIYRGNSPVDVDRLGIGGAVLFEPRLPRTAVAHPSPNAPRASVEASGGLSIGSFGQRGGFVTGSVGGERSAALIAVGQDGATNDFTFAGRNGERVVRTNADFRATTLWTIARHDLGGGARVTTLVHGYDREQGSPGVALVPDELARSRSRRALAAANVHIPCGGLRGEEPSCALDFVTSVLRTSHTVTDPLLELIPSFSVWSLGTRVEQKARATYQKGSMLTLAADASASLEQLRVAALGAPLGADRLSLRPALVGTLRPTTETDLSAVVSLEQHETRGSGAASVRSHGVEPAARLGLAQGLAPGLVMRINLGHYGRAPTLGELHGISLGIHGNAALGAERGDTADLGFRYGVAGAGLRFDAEVFAFLRRVTGLIAYRQSGPSQVAPYNVGSARIAGLEGWFGVEVLNHLRSTLSLTLMDPRDTTDGRSESNDLLPYRSRLVAVSFTELFSNGGLPALAVHRAALGVRITHRASKYADSAGLIVIGEQSPVDLEGSLVLGKGVASVRFSLHNLFDSRELDAIGLPLPGRSAAVSLEGHFQ